MVQLEQLVLQLGPGLRLQALPQLVRLQQEPQQLEQV
jgi:hypothetical protein